jgi:surface carbohydrate biosynthesis protein
MDFLKKFFITIFLSKKTFKKPKKKKILIINKDLSELIIRYIKQNFDILDTRFHYLPHRQLNLYVLIKSFLKLRFSFFDYVCEYIRLVQPKILITLIDNDPMFYKLKSLFPNIKTIMIQNGFRSLVKEDVLSHSKNLKKNNYLVDYYFCFNKKIGNKFKNFLKCNVVSIGSFRSNLHVKKIKKKKYEFMYISVYRFHTKDAPEDIIFLKNLEKYLLKNDKSLTILGSQTFNKVNEHNFYKNIFKNINFNFIERSAKRETYKILDQSNISINIDSTAGYESLSRNNKVGFFCIRGNQYPYNSLKFGWPNYFPNKGLFWTDKNNYVEIERVLNYLTKTNDKQFLNRNNKIINIVMEKDKNNKKFTRYINKLIRK